MGLRMSYKQVAARADHFDAKKQARSSELELTFDALMQLHGPSIPQPVQEYRFAPPRRWRLDRAWPELRCYVEVDGGQFKAGGGRHAGDGDREKRNALALEGWIGLHYSGEMLKADPLRVVAEVAEMIEARSRL